MINAGILMISKIAKSPILSLITIIGMVVFAFGFTLTLISTIKAQWSHQTGEGKFTISGISIIVIGFLIIGVVSACA